MAKIKLTHQELVVLLDHIARGAAHPRVGFEHASITQDELIGRLMGFTVMKEDIESALWSVNLLHELGEYNHPDQVKFDAFVADITPTGYKFDPFFNMFMEE